MFRVVTALVGLAVCVVVLAAVGCKVQISTGPSDDPVKIAQEFGHQGSAVRWEPAAVAGTGLKLALSDRGDGKPMILFVGAGSGGAYSFLSGWAVEAEVFPTETGEAHVGITISDAAAVRFGASRDALRVPTEPMPGDPTKRLFAVHLPPGALDRVKPNDIVALDHRGRLLGRQHYNDGNDGFGEYDGIFDRRFR